MLAYAPRRAMQPARPGLFALILAGHLAVIGTVMATRMVIERTPEGTTKIDWIDEAKPPPPEPRPQVEPTKPSASTIRQPDRIIETIPLGPIAQDPPLPPTPQGPTIGTGTIVEPPLPPIHEVVRKGPRFATAADLVRPPYPESMRASEREAVLRLKLSIDARGRVVAVEPVGRIEAVFLEAARRHILKAWRYTPATEDGKAVPSTTTVTLKFEIGDA